MRRETASPWGKYILRGRIGDGCVPRLGGLHKRTGIWYFEVPFITIPGFLINMYYIQYSCRCSTRSTAVLNLVACAHDFRMWPTCPCCSCWRRRRLNRDAYTVWSLLDIANPVSCVRKPRTPICCGQKVIAAHDGATAISPFGLCRGDAPFGVGKSVPALFWPLLCLFL